MMNNPFIPLLMGKDLRSIGSADQVVAMVNDQHYFDLLFGLLFHHERAIVMRAADAVEKITRDSKEYLAPHKVQLLTLLKGAVNKELKWHLAQFLPRIVLTKEELTEVWHVFTYWAMNRNESKIVRTHALQALFDLMRFHPIVKPDFQRTLIALEAEPVASLQARIRKLKKASGSF
jgi:hypothetical protein